MNVQALYILFVYLAAMVASNGNCDVLRQLPPGSWDTHVHVFDPENHPYVPDTRYTPPPRSAMDLVSETPSRNYVIVMSGPEGTDTALTLETIEELNMAGRQAKGVVVMDLEQMTPAELQRLDAGGVRGVRFNTRRDGFSLEDTVRECAQRIADAELNWAIEAAIFEVALWHSLIPTLRSVNEEHGTVFIADHVFAAQPIEQGSKNLTEVLQLVDDGVLFVKVSGLSRYGRTPQAMIPIITDVLRQNDGRGAIYGSDWPHVISDPGSTELMDVDLKEHLTVLKKICNSVGGGAWEKLMRDNAASLFK